MQTEFLLTSICGNPLKEPLHCKIEDDKNWKQVSCSKLDGRYGIGKNLREAVQMFEWSVISLYFDLRDTPDSFLNEESKKTLNFLDGLFVERPEKPKEDVLIEKAHYVGEDNLNGIHLCPFLGKNQGCQLDNCMMWVSMGEAKGRCGLVNVPYTLTTCATSCEA